MTQRITLPLLLLLTFAFFQSSQSLGQQTPSFSQSQLDFNGVGNINGVTSLMYGPDGRLYVAEYPGKIKILTVQRNSEVQYVVTAIEELDGIEQAIFELVLAKVGVMGM